MGKRILTLVSEDDLSYQEPQPLLQLPEISAEAWRSAAAVVLSHVAVGKRPQHLAGWRVFFVMDPLHRAVCVFSGCSGWFLPERERRDTHPSLCVWVSEILCHQFCHIICSRGVMLACTPDPEELHSTSCRRQYQGLLCILYQSEWIYLRYEWQASLLNQTLRSARNYVCSFVRLKEGFRSLVTSTQWQWDNFCVSTIWVKWFQGVHKYWTCVLTLVILFLVSKFCAYILETKKE